MNPFFWILVILILVFSWFTFSVWFPFIGDIFLMFFEAARDGLSKEDEDESEE